MCGILPNLPDETMTPGRMRIETNGFLEAKKHDYIRKGSVLDFRDALPIGNGDFGASIHGFPDNYTFNIGKNDLWWDDYDAPVPCYVDGGIKQVREKVLAGDLSIKHDIYEASARRRNQPCQTNAARLTLHLCSGTVVANVREKLEISTGYASQTFSSGDTNGIICGNDFNVTSAVSHTDDVMSIFCNGSTQAGRLGYVKLELTRDGMEVCNNIGELSMAEIERKEKEIDEYYSPVPFVDGKYFGFNMRLKAGEDPDNSPDMHYTVLMTSNDDTMKLYTAGHSVFAEGRPKDMYFRLYLTVVSTHDANDTVTEAKKRLSGCTIRGAYSSFGAGYEWFAHNWQRSWIRLPDTKYSFPWYFGIYEAFCARRPGKFAPGYISPWFQSCYANWGYHILTYEQTKSNLGLLAANRAELLEPWFALCKVSQDKIKTFTKNFYNMNGTCFPHAISGTGTVIASSITLNGTEMNIQTAGETVKYAWNYYEFTKDLDFLREIGYPLLKEVAIFYDEYLLEDDDGTKYIFPSRSQEFVNTVGLSNEFMRNSIIDLAFFKFIFKNTSEAAKILGVDEDLQKKWLDDLAHLRPDYATWPDGTWKTSEDCDDRTLDYGLPATTDLAPISMTDEVDALIGDDKLREAALKSVKAFVSDERLPWDLSFGIIARLRMGDKEYAEKVLKWIPESHESGKLERSAYDQDFFVDKGSAYFSESITEMLLQSQGGIIRVFPAYPEAFGDAAFCSLRARGAFLVSAEMRNEKTAYVIIRSLKGEQCRIVNPIGDNVRIRNLETQDIIDYTDENGIISFSTVAEHEYVVENIEKPLESFPVIK